MEPFIGMGHNPQGPDLPLGLSMGLAQDAQAMACYGGLSQRQQADVIAYIQGATSGGDARQRVEDAIGRLHRGSWR